MSGFIGLLQPNPSPHHLQTLLTPLTRRGPDGQRTHLDPHIALGHTWLQTAPHTTHDQPLTHDNHIWLLGDIRLDDRPTLRQHLRQANHPLPATTSNASLVWHAYRAWGQTCVQHLQGDFAFAIWDATQKSLFCARDHWGIKPFFYAPLPDGLLFGNTLASLRQHPALTPAINQDVMAEILLFGWNRNLSATLQQAIAKLPPAHTLLWQNGTLTIQRYWTLPVPPPLLLPRPEQTITHFKTLFTQAIQDRLGTPTIEIAMSGGLDSTAIAATAHHLLTQQYPQPDLYAYTYIQSNNDPEGHYAQQVAHHLGIQLDLIRPGTPTTPWPDITDLTPRPPHNTTYNTHSRVALSGLGGDPLLHPSHLPLWQLSQQFGWRKTAQLAHWHWQLTHTHPPLYLRTTWRRWHKQPTLPPLPHWFNPHFVQQHHLQARWAQFHQQFHTHTNKHPTRPEAYFNLTSRLWPQTFQENDPGHTHTPTEIRYPFLDLRLVNFLLALPPLPWFTHKTLLRLAMKNTLPEPVRQRPKTLHHRPPPPPPTPAWLERQFTLLPQLTHYFSLKQIQALFQNPQTPQPTKQEIGWQIRRIGQWFIYTTLTI